MNEEQIELLQLIIRGEIEAALQNAAEARFAHEQEKLNEKRWREFNDSFNEAQYLLYLARRDSAKQ